MDRWRLHAALTLRERLVFVRDVPLGLAVNRIVVRMLLLMVHCVAVAFMAPYWYYITLGTLVETLAFPFLLLVHLVMWKDLLLRHILHLAEKELERHEASREASS